MGAQMVEAIREVFFTSPEDSVLITLSNGRTLEIFGDGFVQEKHGERIVESQL